ncbi:MAG: DoxX family membrane protein [Bdellovibrionaceae bacterium]|jgi:thiosulfate dehydrogenase (quinone) large subunit|nr:DoxX family membrane protein [Pseudobdellovibrionaceae bacterium]
MIVSFFESFKYIGHLLPVAFLRIFIGYYFVNSASKRSESRFLEQPQLAELINEWVPMSIAPELIKDFLQDFVVAYWQIFAHIITYSEYIVGIGFIIGFLVRPLSVLGVSIVVFFMFISNPADILVYKLFIAVFFTLSWLGAGRCMGVDYFFFKRHRGIWW